MSRRHIKPESLASRIVFGAGMAAFLAWQFWPTTFFGSVGLLAIFFMVMIGHAYLWPERPTQAASAPMPSPFGRVNAASAEGKAPTTPEITALCVFRYATVNSPSYYRVDLNGQRIADLKANQYALTTLSRGPQRLTTNVRISLARDIVEEFTAAPGDFVIYHLHTPYFGRAHLERLTDEAAARNIVRRLKPAGGYARGRPDWMAAWLSGRADRVGSATRLRR